MSWSTHKGQLKTLRASGALPASGAWDTAPDDDSPPLVSDFAEVTFFADYTVGGSGGACELRFEGSPVSSGDDWYPLEEVLDTAAASLSGQSLPIPLRTASVIVTGTQRAPGHTVRLGGFERVRVLARETGNTGAPGTLRVRARASTGSGS